MTQLNVKIEETPEDALVLTVLELAAQLTKNGNLITEQVGLTTQQWLIMLYICGDPNIPFLDKKISVQGLFASDIADALNVSKPNITNMLNTLQEKGLVKQTLIPNDRRKKHLEITQRGKEVLEQIEIERNKANQSLLMDLTKEQRHLLLDYLQVCLKRIKRIK